MDSGGFVTASRRDTPEAVATVTFTNASAQRALAAGACPRAQIARISV
jgi:hypothetical protein